MPEGHTIHRLARDLRRDLAGAEVRSSSPQGRFADGAARSRPPEAAAAATDGLKSAPGAKDEWLAAIFARATTLKSPYCRCSVDGRMTVVDGHVTLSE